MGIRVSFYNKYLSEFLVTVTIVSRGDWPVSSTNYAVTQRKKGTLFHVESFSELSSACFSCVYLCNNVLLKIKHNFKMLKT